MHSTSDKYDEQYDEQRGGRRHGSRGRAERVREHLHQHHHHGGFGPGGAGPRGGRGFGPGGFGPGGFGPGGFGPGFGRGARRARKGDVRAAILSLLAQSPANGYALIKAIGEQSGGAWNPSPGSIYPTLAQLVDEGLIAPVDSAAPRSDYQLTDAGRAYVDKHATELSATWDGLNEQGELGTTGELFQATGKLLGVLRQYATEATDDQKRAAVGKLDELRREFYRILGE